MLQIQPDTAPIRIDDDGTARIGETRVPLETVISAFQRGETPEQIIDSYDVLTLAQVYAVIAYYLNHRDEVETYLEQQAVAAKQVRHEIETNRPDMLQLQKRFEEQKKQI